MKDFFGGSPNFAQHKPVREPNTHTFAGIPIESVQTWVSKGLKNIEHDLTNKLLWPIYQIAARLFGVSEPETKYEYISKHLESMSFLETNPTIIQKFKKGIDSTVILGEATGLTCHAGDNGALTIGLALEEHLELLKKYHTHNKALGSEALKAFFNEAFDDGAVCIEARLTHFNNYVSSHPLSNGASQNPTNHFQLDLERVPFSQVMEHDFANFITERSKEGLAEAIPKTSEFEAYLKRAYGDVSLLGKNCVDLEKSEKSLDDKWVTIVTRPIKQSDMDDIYDYFVDTLFCMEDDRVKNSDQLN
jgi:hypothetical protein